MPPSEITATSLVPPPMSRIMLPVGSDTGRPAPVAAAESGQVAEQAHVVELGCLGWGCAEQVGVDGGLPARRRATAAQERCEAAARGPRRRAQCSEGRPSRKSRLRYFSAGNAKP